MRGNVGQRMLIFAKVNIYEKNIVARRVLTAFGWMLIRQP
jgi:hypothetical protein